MADSDDEYDRKRRDKFRGERTESYSRERRDDRRRDDWVERYSYTSYFYNYTHSTSRMINKILASSSPFVIDALILFNLLNNVSVIFLSW